MTTRRRAAAKITESFFGGFDSTPDRSISVHSFVSREARSSLDILSGGRDNVEKRAEDLWEHIVNSLDWNRILISATAEHLRRQKADVTHKSHTLVQDVCAECVQYALLTKDR